MKDTLLYLIGAIVDHPDAASVDESDDEGRIILTVSVAPEDMGKIIGKNGRIIRAIRDLIKLMAAKQDLYVDVVLRDDERPAAA